MSHSARPLSEIEKISASDLKARLTSSSDHTSQEAGLKLTKDAASFGLNMRDYLILSVDRGQETQLNGYELMLAELNLPFRNDFENGISLQAASETFQTYAGTRALFPTVIDDMLRFANRQDTLETVAPLVANTRTTVGVELLSTIVEDDSKDRDSFVIAEMSNIPVRTIKTSEKSVKFYKHGSAIRTSYEFSRRASLDILVPYANRIGRELERSKLAAAVGTLINGDGAYGAAPVVNQSSYNTQTGVTATDGKINWQHFVYWLIQRAQAGTPIDTVVMNWDGYYQWLTLFTNPASATGAPAMDNLRQMGVDVERNAKGIQLLSRITPVLASAMPAGQLLGLSQGDTLEELKESGSDINETDRAIKNQTITVVRTENSGYRLVFGDTRSVFKFKEA